MAKPDPHESPIGVLLLQLGTPDAPTASALRPYLRQFLSDRRVIEVHPWLWALILNLAVLPFRPRASAEKYARVWSPEHGSPLLHYTRRQSELLGKRLGPGFAVDFGMRYGKPSIAAGLARLVERGAERIVALPLYPQYAASSTASACDALFAALQSYRNMPALRIVPPYPEDPGYLDAVAARVRECASTAGRVDHTLVSFHGLPVAMVEKGDPYRVHCEATTRALVERLGLESGRWSQTFQSRFGREAWLEPFTEAHLQELARQGVKRVLVVAPGFTTDCLETLDELGHEALVVFRKAGGEALTLVPCLNDHPAWIEALGAIVLRESQGWRSAPVA